MSSEAFRDLVRNVGHELESNITGGRYSAMDVAYSVPPEQLAALMDAAIECGYAPKRAKKIQTLAFKYSPLDGAGIQLYNMGWGAGEKSGCIIVEKDHLYVTWTSCIG